mgnify:CR=1 FL=1
MCIKYIFDIMKPRKTTCFTGTSFQTQHMNKESLTHFRNIRDTFLPEGIKGDGSPSAEMRTAMLEHDRELALLLEQYEPFLQAQLKKYSSWFEKDKVQDETALSEFRAGLGTLVKQLIRYQHKYQEAITLSLLLRSLKGTHLISCVH